MSGKIFWSIIVIVITIAIGVILTNNFGRQSKEVKEFKIRAFKYGFEPNDILIKKGDKIKIIINNSDILHGIYIPDLEIRGNDMVEFIASKQGQFIWYCNNYCGEGHGRMQGKLTIE